MSKLKVIPISNKEMGSKIDEFLLNHEVQIALGADDYYLLEPLFIYSQQREPLIDGLPYSEWYKTKWPKIKKRDDNDM